MSEQLGLASDRMVRVALVAQALTAALDPTEVLEIVVRQGMAGLEAEGGVVALLDPGGVLTPAITVGYPKERIAAFAPLTVDRSLPLTDAVREKTAVWVRSTREARSRFPELIARPETTSQAWAAIPLMMDGAALGVLGVSFLAPRSFSEDERLFIRSLADLCALALARYYAPSRTSPSTEAQPPPTAIGRFDRALGHVFASTLTLAGVLTLGRVDREVALRLHDAIDELDTAIREIRRGAFEMSIRETDEGFDAVEREPAISNPGSSNGLADPRRPEHQRQLCRFDDNQVFAYKRGHDLIRVADHTLWAHESGEILLSARSGRPIARRVGKTYLDVESDTPLYYELTQ
jgi:signal transduction protein with GAF and PtsI domain